MQPSQGMPRLGLQGSPLLGHSGNRANANRRVRLWISDADDEEAWKEIRVPHLIDLGFEGVVRPQLCLERHDFCKRALASIVAEEKRVGGGGGSGGAIVPAIRTSLRA